MKGLGRKYKLRKIKKSISSSGGCGLPAGHELADERHRRFVPESGEVHASEGLSSSRPNERSPDFGVTCTVCKDMFPKDGPPHNTLKANSSYHSNETKNNTKDDSEQFDKDLQKATLDPVEVVELGSAVPNVHCANSCFPWILKSPYRSAAVLSFEQPLW